MSYAIPYSSNLPSASRLHHSETDPGTRQNSTVLCLHDRSSVVASNSLTTRVQFSSNRAPLGSRVNRSLQSLKYVLITLCCLVFFETILGVSAHNETCSLVRPEPLFTPFPPSIASIEYATVAGRQLVPSHLANMLTDSLYSIGILAIGHVYKKVREIGVTSDLTKSRFVAALGLASPVFETGQEDIKLLRIPRLSASRIEVQWDSGRSVSYMRVNASEMSDVIMRGTLSIPKPLIDNRQFIAVKVENVFTGDIFTQVFHQAYPTDPLRYAHPLDTKRKSPLWVASYGPILWPEHQVLNLTNMLKIAALFNGMPVVGLDRQLYRLVE